MKPLIRILATKMAELEQRWQQLLSGDSENTALEDVNEEEEEELGYAPSQLLLNGYCAAMVDDVGPDEVEAAAVKPAETANTHISEPYDARTTGLLQSDDGMSSLSSESADSSVYGIDVRLNELAVNTYKSTSPTTDSGNYNGTPRVSSAVVRERKEDLKDLPPHLAELVQKALNELDMRDYEAMVTIRAENASKMH